MLTHEEETLFLNAYKIHKDKDNKWDLIMQEMNIEYNRKIEFQNYLKGYYKRGEKPRASLTQAVENANKEISGNLQHVQHANAAISTNTMGLIQFHTVSAQLATTPTTPNNSKHTAVLSLSINAITFKKDEYKRIIALMYSVDESNVDVNVSVTASKTGKEYTFVVIVRFLFCCDTHPMLLNALRNQEVFLRNLNSPWSPLAKFVLFNSYTVMSDVKVTVYDPPSTSSFIHSAEVLHCSTSTSPELETTTATSLDVSASPQRKDEPIIPELCTTPNSASTAISKDEKCITEPDMVLTISPSKRKLHVERRLFTQPLKVRKLVGMQAASSYIVYTATDSANGEQAQGVLDEGTSLPSGVTRVIIEEVASENEVAVAASGNSTSIAHYSEKRDTPKVQDELLYDDIKQEDTDTGDKDAQKPKMTGGHDEKCPLCDSIHSECLQCPNCSKVACRSCVMKMYNYIPSSQTFEYSVAKCPFCKVEILRKSWKSKQKEIVANLAHHVSQSNATADATYEQFISQPHDLPCPICQLKMSEQEMDVHISWHHSYNFAEKLQKSLKSQKPQTHSLPQSPPLYAARQMSREFSESNLLQPLPSPLPRPLTFATSEVLRPQPSQYHLLLSPQQLPPSPLASVHPPHSTTPPPQSSQQTASQLSGLELARVVELPVDLLSPKVESSLPQVALPLPVVALASNEGLPPSRPVVSPLHPVTSPLGPVVSPSLPITPPSHPVVSPSLSIASPSRPAVSPLRPVAPMVNLPSDQVASPSHQTATHRGPVASPRPSRRALKQPPSVQVYVIDD